MSPRAKAANAVSTTAISGSGSFMSSLRLAVYVQVPAVRPVIVLRNVLEVDLGREMVLVVAHGELAGTQWPVEFLVPRAGSRARLQHGPGEGQQSFTVTWD